MFIAIAASTVASLIALWLAFVVVLVVAKPDPSTLLETARIIADTLRLVRRLAADRSLHWSVRVRLWFLLLYLALPIDIIPDFIPVIGFADDAIIMGLVLRSLVRSAGPDKIRELWPGTPDGLDALARLCRLPRLSTGSSRRDQASPTRDKAPAPTPDRQSLRAGFVLEGITLGWNAVGIAILTIAALTARSVALGGFALDSLIEIGASAVVIWELSGAGEERQHKALRTIGGMFILLAIYLALQSTYVLATGHHAKHSTLGIVWTAFTAAVMFGLAFAKTRVGRRLDNPVLQTEGRVTLIDAFLATTVLVGLAVNAGFDWWWADPTAGYLILFYGVKEGLAALRSGSISPPVG